MPLSAELQAVLDHEIPLTKAMGLKVEEAASAKVLLGFPLEPNHNHKQTAFGGSLYSALVTAGWSTAWCMLKEMNVTAQIVVASGSERFLRAVGSNFTAECSADRHVLDEALEGLARKGKARLELKCYIRSGNITCAEFDGVYALIGV